MQKIFESKKGEIASLIVNAQKNQWWFFITPIWRKNMMKNQNSAQKATKKTVSNKTSDKRKLLAQPMPQNGSEYIKEKILCQGPWISRGRLCRICPLFNKNTLRNWDYQLIGIPGKKNIGPRKLACYPTQNVVDFMEDMFCKRPLLEKENYDEQEEYDIN